MTLRLPTRMRSFRFRIALLSTFLSGFVLMAFCTGAWLLILRVNLHRVDEDIRRAGLGPLSMHQRPRDWANFDESVRFVLGEEGEDPVILLVKGRDDRVLYQSPNWPAELSPDAFPPPVEAESGPPPGDFPGPAVPEPDRWERFPPPPEQYAMEPPPGEDRAFGPDGGFPRRPPRGPRGPGGPPPPAQ